MTTATEKQLAETTGITDSLSTADVVEIRKFAEGKTRIIDLTETLSSTPALYPFEGFIRVDEQQFPTVEIISNAWQNLEEKLRRVTKWQDERDSIEAEATQFEVDDMERLRKVAKAATEREMSPQDTDLIEITIQTLVALDTLLRLLKSRREALDLLQGRLNWEERRKDCWSTYVSLSHDLDDFIRQARWSPQIYQRSTAPSESIADADESHLAGASTSEWSPLTARSTNGLTTTSHAKRQAVKVKTQSIALQSRCRSFVEQVVPLASKQLDDLIEQRQVPEAFLDEQDRLEDLAESVKDVEVFMIQLSVQWRKADDIFRQLRSLHIQGKQLTASLTSALRETPSEERLEEFRELRDLLKQKMEALCGAQLASAFISDPGFSTDLLIDSVQKAMPQPTCEKWPDQEQHSNEVQTALAKEMVAAAKHVRSACHSADKYERGLHLHSKSHDVVLRLKETASALKKLGERARQGWIEESDADRASQLAGPLAGSSRDGTAPDFDSFDCLDVQKHGAYLQAFPALLARLREIEQEGQSRIMSLEQVMHDYVREGLPHSLYKGEAAQAMHEVKAAQNEAKAAFDHAKSSIELLKKVRAVASQMDQMEKDCQVCIDAETTATQTLGPLLIEEIQGQANSLALRVGEVNVAIQLQKKALEAREASSLLGVLLDRSSLIRQSVESIHDNGKWLQAREKQQRQLKLLHDEHARLTEAGRQVKIQLEEWESSVTYMLHSPEESAQQDASPSRRSVPPSEKDTISKQIQEYVSATHSDIVLCGPAPDHLLRALQSKSSEDAYLPAPDEAARRNVNEWCSLLSSLTEEIEAAWQDAHQRQVLAHQKRDNIAVQQESLIAELINFDKTVAEVKAVCDTKASEKADRTARLCVLNVQETLQQASQRLSDVAKQDQCSPSLTTRLEKNREQALLLVDRAQSLTQQSEKHAESKLEEVHAVGLEQDPGHPSPVSSVPSLSLSSQYKADQSILQPVINDQSSTSERGEKVRLGDITAAIPFTRSSHPREEDRKQRSDPLPMSSNHAKSKGGHAAEDVFGSVPLKETFSMPVMIKSKVAQVDVKDKVRELMLQCSDGVVEEQIQANGKLQFQNGLPLPTLDQAESINEEWKGIKAIAESVVEKSDSLPTSEADQVRMTLQLRDAKVRRFTLLAAFGAQHTSTEEALSRFLNVLDQSGEKDMKVKESLAEVSKSISQATQLAEPILTDARVRHQLSQLRHSYQDMAAMAKETCIAPEERDNLDDTRSTCPSRSSSSSSVPSLSGSNSDVESLLGEQSQNSASLLMAPSSQSLNFDMPETPLTGRRRLQSSSSGTFATAPQSTPRQSTDRRVVSEGIALITPSRLPIPTSRSNIELSTPKGVPRSGSIASMTTRTPQSSSFYGHRARSRSDSGSLPLSKLPTRSPSIVSLRGSTPQKVSSSSSSSKPNQYRANPKSKLDVAVAKIVNKLPMPVKITHASSGAANVNANATGSKAVEQWHDESGRYWVGHPDPKLCFCRILRSRTVMVRIGGGWQELGTYILKHFSHLGNDADLSMTVSPHVSPQLDRGKMEKLPWISSTTLLQTPTLHQTPTGKNTSVKTAEASPESAYLTPVHERDERDEAGGSAGFKSTKVAPISSPLSLHAQFEKTNRNTEDMHGMWIRRNRKTSQSSITRISPLTHPKEAKSDHHTRSTLASRNRKASSGKFVETRRRVESLSGGSQKDKIESGGANQRVRAESISLATIRQPRDRVILP